MINDPQDPRPHAHLVQPLDYRPAAVDRQDSSKGQVIAGAIVSVMLTMVVAFVGIIASEDSRPFRISVVRFLVIVGAFVLGINSFAFWAYRKPQFRSLAIRLWIGFGVAVLIEGACFGLAR
jgi:high-affinity Fe2+/Pb2+ permease